MIQALAALADQIVPASAPNERAVEEFAPVATPVAAPAPVDVAPPPAAAPVPAVHAAAPALPAVGVAVRHWRVIVAGVLLLALASRLLWIFVIGDPQNAGVGVYDDAYHHWQIAYLTQTIGIHNGPRLWDLKGAEYFWGIVQPIVLAPLMALLHTPDILVERLMTVACGLGIVAILMSLCRRYWGERVAIAAGAVAAVAPCAIVTDSSGMLEPLSLLLLLGAVWLVEADRFALAGLALGVAAATRVEDLAVGGLVLLVLLARPEAAGRRTPLIATWAMALGGYLLVLHDQTGDWIYSYRLNLDVNAAGPGVNALTSSQAALRPLLLLCGGAAALAFCAVLVLRPRAMAFLGLGLGSSTFILALLGATHFLSNWHTWFWGGRFLDLPMLFVATLLVAGVDALLRRRPNALSPRAALRWVGVGAVTLAAIFQAQWFVLASAYATSEPHWQFASTAGDRIAGLATSLPLGDGRVNIPQDAPELTYAVVRAGVDGPHILGQLYDPFGGTPDPSYATDTAADDSKIACWLRETSTRVWVVGQARTDYLAFAASYPAAVHPAFMLDGYGIPVFTVDPSALPSASC